MKKKKDQVLDSILKSIREMTVEEYDSLYESITEGEKVKVVTEDFDVYVTYESTRIISLTSFEGFRYSYPTPALEESPSFSDCGELAIA